MGIGGWFAVSAFAGGMVAVNRLLRAREDDGSFDVAGASSAQPGLRRFFDFSTDGWRRDGVRQPPAAR